METNLKNFWNKYKYMIISLLIIALYVSPYIILKQNVIVPDFDNLDADVSRFTILAHSDVLFGNLSSVIPQYFNGLDRNLFPGEFNLTVWLFYLFPPYTAYAICEIFLHFLGFFSMLLLLSNFILPKNCDKRIIYGISVAFAILPVWSPVTLCTIHSQPMALFALLNIRKGNYKWYNWLILTIIPFIASFELSFFFFNIMVGCLWLYDWIKTKKINWKFFWALVYFTFVFCFVNYRLFYMMFFNHDFTTHRVEFNLTNGYVYLSTDFLKAAKIGLSMIFFGDGYPHTKSMGSFVAIPAILFSILACIYKRIKCTRLWLITATIFLIASFQGIWCCWEHIDKFKKIIPFLMYFQFDRFYFLAPMLVHIAFALACCCVIAKHFKRGLLIALILITAHIIRIFAADYTFKNSIHYMYHKETKYPSYRQFFAQNQFNHIKEFIGKPQSSYRVVSLGIHPGIASYNGFYVLDGYFVSYPLEYKHKFRKIIAKELDKSLQFKAFYDDWGSRVYVFAAELDGFSLIHPQKTYVNKGTDVPVECEKFANDKYIDIYYFIYNPQAARCGYLKDGKLHHVKAPGLVAQINNLELNTRALKDMGGEYIISGVYIKNAAQNNLRLLKKFTEEDSYYNIYLYKVL